MFQTSMAAFNIMTADSGAAALALLEAHQVAVIVTDIRMPVMTGDELLTIVKDKYPHIVRMVITAHQDVGPILRAINDGLVARYVVKPWVRAELEGVLQWACEAHAFGRDSQALQRRLMETERLATLGSIAGLLVHDLRQPLVAQLINLDHLLELSADAAEFTAAVRGSGLPQDVAVRLIELLEELPPTLGDIRLSTEHLNTMISSLHNLGKPNRAGQPAVEARAEPQPLIRRAISVCQELTIKARSTIRYQGPGELPQIRISATELLQVLINVIANAAQAVAGRGEPGGRVTIDARVDATNLVIEIADTGGGMPPDVLAKVGTPFFTTRTDGTGLGVAQCQRLIGAAGGQFTIDSEPGVGTTVSIRVPLAPTTSSDRG